jgi:hypothetical protein
MITPYNLIREVFGWNLILDTAYPDRSFSWYSSVHPGEGTPAFATTASFQILFNSLLTNRPTNQRYNILLLPKPHKSTNNKGIWSRSV